MSGPEYSVKRPLPAPLSALLFCPSARLMKCSLSHAMFTYIHLHEAILRTSLAFLSSDEYSRRD